MKAFFVILDLTVAAVFALLGLLFYECKERACTFIPDYRRLSEDERALYDTVHMSTAFRNRFLAWGAVFAIAAILDGRTGYLGCLLAWTLCVFALIRRANRIESSLERYRRPEPDRTNKEKEEVVEHEDGTGSGGGSHPDHIFQRRV